MSAIPLHDLDEVVTTADLRAEIAELRTEVRTGLASLEASSMLSRRPCTHI